MAEAGKFDGEALWREVESYFGADADRIEHTRRVLDFARRILAQEKGDRDVVEAAAMLHDIGIPEALRRHGSSAGPYQEKEGVPIAREILERLGAPAELTEHVCGIVGSHHSLGEVETPEFAVIWDADGLVNFPREHDSPDREGRAKRITSIFQTARGRELAREIFLGQ